MAQKLDLTDPMLAEAIFWFCNDPEQIDDNNHKTLVYDDLSMAEFVQKYKYKQFCTWYGVVWPDLRANIDD